MSYVIEHGGEVEVERPHEATKRYDRIIFTDSGMVVCINKAAYSKDCYPREKVEVHTHTSDEEESAEWW